MNKKLVVLASALIFGLFTLTSVQTTAATIVGYGVEAADDCGGENGKSCGTAEGKSEAGSKKSCCSGGGESKSCSDKKGEKKETKTETKTEEKKK